MTQLSNFPAQLRGFPDISACAVRFFAYIVPMKAAVRPDDPYILIIRLRRNGYAVRGSRYTIPNISDFTSASYFTATAHKFQLFLLIFFVLYDIWHRHGAYSGYRESCFFRYNPDIPFPTCLRHFYGIIPQYYIQFHEKKDRLPDDADALFFSDIYAFAAGANKAARFRTAFHDRNSLILFFLRDESTATEYDSNRRGFCRGTSGDTAPRERSSQAA